MNLIEITHNWFFWSILATFCMATLAQFNFRRKLDPQFLNAWQSTFAVLFLCLALPFLDWPSLSTQKLFYIVAIGAGVVMAAGMACFFWLATRQTGRVTSMVIPLAAVSAYITWLVLVPEQRPDFIQHPFKVAIALFSILSICLALQKVRANDASWDTFIFVLPVGLAFGLRDAFTKWVLLGERNIYVSSLSFILLASLTCAVIAWLIALPRPAGGRSVKAYSLKLLLGGVCCGLCTAILLASGVVALSLAPNPSYPGILMAMTPVWLYAWNYLRDIHDEFSPVPGFFIIIGALGLIISTL